MENKKENDNMKTPKNYFKTLIKIIIVIMAFTFGYVTNEIISLYNKNVEITTKTLPSTKTSDDIQVSINDRGELLLIDTKTGKYEIYSNEIREIIFRISAVDIYIKKQQDIN